MQADIFLIADIIIEIVIYQTVDCQPYIDSIRYLLNIDDQHFTLCKARWIEIGKGLQIYITLLIT